MGSPNNTSVHSEPQNIALVSQNEVVEKSTIGNTYDQIWAKFWKFPNFSKKTSFMNYMFDTWNFKWNLHMIWFENIVVAIADTRLRATKYECSVGTHSRRKKQLSVHFFRNVEWRTMHAVYYTHLDEWMLFEKNVQSAVIVIVFSGLFVMNIWNEIWMTRTVSSGFCRQNQN